ncbi:LysM peptidoglycan-binding domain-containing protein [Kingella negevensis]|nr:LysM peptidoglycan-binding domain-containing protein [Kingella negevensis]MDK4679910.1 LysM peptidoglycan-binding domain-containing protein [Kingella negevensis]MDK4682371.1 LysM peptidoglycan-binding domain-containing protein [Kingella negevensis]MDK4690568.1 LysM peptidoglycan-binding domain-containing protein [Kingella negevensis]MDK4692084.1 LysM peptidoglycan-binding domain-containing protein [Kingella negevensis]MDK4698389.1 LysM peptidoglycan-binding domain-containing protein [Kingel
MKHTKTIALAISGLFILPNLAYGKEFQPAQTSAAMMRMQTFPFSASSSSTGFVSSLFGSGDIWGNLRKNFRMNEVNSSLVRSHESKFVNNSAYFNRTIQRSTPYMYHIANEVNKRNMPAEVALLPFIESAYVTKAKSHVGASGLWQFMPATGRHYGLEQTPLYDGRHDVYAATDAALDYLQYLYGLFGDWSLALAAYNWGEGNMSRAVNRAMAAGLPPTYENLRMPNETRNYVPKLLAVRNLVRNPQSYGLSLPDIKSEPYFKAVEVKTPMDIMAAAHLANISEDEFLRLNPAFKTPVFIPKDNRRMLLPVDSVRTFESNYKDADKKALLSWDVFTPDSRMALTDIANQTGSSVSELKQLNGVSGTHINAGRSILVAKNRASGIRSIADFAKADVDNTPDTFVEQQPVLRAGALNTVVPVARTTPVVATSNQIKAPVQEVVATTSVATSVVTEAVYTSVAQPAPKAEVAQANTVEASTPVETTVTQVINIPVIPEESEATRLTQEAQERAETQERIRVALEKADAEEAKARAISELRAAEERKRQQQIAAAEKAKAEAQAKAEAVAAKKAELELAQAKAKGIHKVSSGDTLSSIAVRYDVSVADLVFANNIKANHIETGQTLKINVRNSAKAAELAAVKKAELELAQAKGIHKVVNGDTLFNIAGRYDVSVADLIAANNIKGNHIEIGQKLKVTVKNSAKRTETTKVENDSRKSDASKSIIPATHTVKKGETLEGLAARYGLKVNDLKRFNNGESTIKVGQKIKLS